MRVGDVIGCGPGIDRAQEVAGRYWLGPADGTRQPGTVLRYTHYMGLGRVDPESQAVFERTKWSVSEASDRMGIRLASRDAPLPPQSREVVSFGVVKGAIQLPPAGTPVVLGPDHQTTGGYPLLGVVIEADFPLLAQLRPGDEVSFVEVTIEQALEERERARRDLLGGITALQAGR